MNKTLKLTLDIPMSINALYGRNKFGSVYMKKEGKQYKERMDKVVKQSVKEQEWIKTNANEFVYMDEVVYMNCKGRDSDNLKKLTQDVITESGVVWEDDSYCLPRTHRIFIDTDNPRLELEITRTGFIGIFESDEMYNSFILSNCSECKRGKKGNCSIHKNALDNRIQEEIDIINLTCSKKK